MKIKVLCVFFGLVLASLAHASPCDGTYVIHSAGNTGQLSFQGYDSTGNFQGTIGYPGYPTYSVNGICSLTSRYGGQIQFTDSLGQIFVGQFVYQNYSTSLNGTFSWNGKNYGPWDAEGGGGGYSQNYDCQGQFVIHSAGNTGTLTINAIGNGGIQGSVSYSQYPNDPISGSCTNTGYSQGQISFTRYSVNNIQQVFQGNWSIDQYNRVTMTGAFYWNGQPVGSWDAESL
jgi:hypothetical protein